MQTVNFKVKKLLNDFVVSAVCWEAFELQPLWVANVLVVPVSMEEIICRNLFILCYFKYNNFTNKLTVLKTIKHVFKRIKRICSVIFGFS